MNKAKAQEISKALKDALAGIEERFGVKALVEGGKFDETTFSPKIDFAEVEGGVVVTKELTALRAFHPGIEGRLVKLREGEYRVIGFRTSATRYPFIVEPVNGGKAKVCTADLVFLAN